MWSRIVKGLMLGVMTAGLIVGCGLQSSNTSVESPVSSESTQAANCRLIEHDLGETEVCGQPEKIVTLSLHALDLLLSLGEQPVGCTMTININQKEVFDNPTQQIPYLGDRLTTQPVNLGDDHAPSLEKLTALKPDLILGEASRNADEYELLSQIAPTLLWENRAAQGQWQESLHDITAALGHEEKAEAVIQQYEARIDDAGSDLAGVVAKYPKLLVLGSNHLDQGFLVVKPDSYLGELLSRIGFQVIPPPAAYSSSNTPLISIEALPKLNNADIIIVLGWDFDVSDGLETSAPAVDKSVNDSLETHQVQTIKQDWEDNAIAQSLTASQDNRVYFATFYKWNGLNGPIGAELILQELRQFFLE
ncbi:Fe(3+)-citrate-binding protein YfmC [Halomicronema hongdechloris C2206]|uniref:Fe(3+)-citrate-binding protein YfmC n=1 Tax=Halomicronema hongdechloris C2206 TaxID=1641165 RepID=A0A1Z3HQW3_9CYAN|nr:iron-siderophore ABC transporter substrate-binding protein [Halomicronema hongdechloris]ASC72646.1 Fe(3+)-citrate-binding protein YfmC [Halomicronema hongdechloris C2206]